MIRQQILEAKILNRGSMPITTLNPYTLVVSSVTLHIDNDKLRTPS
jgi:hypothetical protein